MRYTLTYRKSVKKELQKVPVGVRKALVKKILALADDPRPNGVTKLQGTENIYRLRQGDYRLIYTVYDDIVVVEVIKVGHRSDVYKKR